MAMGPFSEGPKPPEVISPIAAPPGAWIGVCRARAGGPRADADAQALRAVVEFVAHALGAGEIPFGAAALADGPGQRASTGLVVSSMSLP
jgi:hypothetical protein